MAGLLVEEAVGDLLTECLCHSRALEAEVVVSRHRSVGSVTFSEIEYTATTLRQRTWRLPKLVLDHDRHDCQVDFHMPSWNSRLRVHSASGPKLPSRPNINRPRLPQSLQFFLSFQLLLLHHNKLTIAFHYASTRTSCDSALLSALLLSLLWSRADKAVRSQTPGKLSIH
jgi:hypothetical protein